jgi:hypothetical protein
VDALGSAFSTNGEKRNAYCILVRKPEGRRSLKEQEVDGWMLLKWILER